MRKSVLFIFIFVSILAHGEPNCNIYKMEGNQKCYEACILATEGGGSQGSRSSQEKFDEAIEKCPNLDYAWMEKAVPYLKRGDFATWKKIIDKAVELNPQLHLGYRGWCRYQFLRDYKGAIRDIERLDSMREYEIGYSQNGAYQLNIAKALCYKALGQKAKAIAIIEKQLGEKDYSPLTYDLLHLGVLKMETGDTKGAVAAFRKSIAINDYIAEPYYYLGLIYKKGKQTKEYKESMQKAKEFYLKNYRMSDPYTHPMDKVYLTEIEKELTN